MYWDFECYVRGDGERAHSTGALYLTNVQQLYERAPKISAIPDPILGVLGADPKVASTAGDEFAARIAKRGGPVAVVNDEAHHTWSEDSEWMRAIFRVDDAATVGIQLDFTATRVVGNHKGAALDAGA